jgi:NCS1 family nucleobase:cation symporter-1
MSALLEDVHESIVLDGVPPAQQTMTPEKVFWAHLCTNLIPATWVLGALLIVMGLDFTTGVAAILIGTLLGSAIVAASAMLGPRTGHTQVEISRYSFGRLGTRIPAVLTWFNSVAWEAVGSVPSALAFGALFALYGITLPFWVGMVLIVSVQLVVSIYGHHVVQYSAKYLCYVLAVLFTGAGIVAILKGGAIVHAHAAIKPAIFVLGCTMTTGTVLGFAPYTSDYTRYLPRSTKQSNVFWLAFAGLCTSAIALELFGLLTATRLTDLSTAGVVKGIATLTGPFAPLALLALAVSAIPTNSINDNTASYSMISAGFRIPRHIAAIISTTSGFVLALIGAAKFADLFSGFLGLSMYWIAPWTAIMLTDWWLYRGAEHRVRRWATGATIFVVVLPVTVVLFVALPFYTGPIANLLGGVDIGYVAGFIVSAAAYALIERPRTVEQPTFIAAGEPAE